MNDHELRLQLLKVQVPTPDAGAAARALDESLAALESNAERHRGMPRTPAQIRVAESRWTWRDWLWPSPLAWGSLALVWLAIFLAEQPPGATKAGHPTLADEAVQNRKIQTPDLLFAHHEYQLLLREHRSAAPAGCPSACRWS